jgi:hypothetical protein
VDGRRLYHLTHFRPINPAAVAFGVVFIAQGALLAWLGAWRGRLAFVLHADAVGVTGGLLVLYALAAYPALGHLLGHRYPAVPTFGTPCPTTIFTFGLFLWLRPQAPRIVVAIPALWTVVGVAAAMRLGMREDFGLVAAGVLGTLGVLARHRAWRHDVRQLSEIA